MVGHPGGDARPLERWTEMGLVVAPDPSPRTRKTHLLRGSRVSGERDERWARLEEGPLTDAATHGQAVLLCVKVVSVAAAAAVKEGGALPLGHIKVPAGDHGSARPRLGLFRAHL